MPKLLLKLARHLERESRRNQKELLREQRQREREAHRDAKRREKELQRAVKEQARLTALEQARLEVEVFENRVEVLLSMHKDAVAPIDWLALASRLRPCEPKCFAENEFEARLMALAGADAGNPETMSLLEEGRRLDAHEFNAHREAWTSECARVERERALAQRIQSGDLGAYVEAVAEFAGLSELKDLGSSFEVVASSARLVECRLTANGRGVIPNEVLALTSASKVTRKAMPKARFQEIYQDHVCSCVLRIAREVLAVLPIDSVIVTASVTQVLDSTADAGVVPVLSVAFPRAAVASLAFDTLDPSDTIETLVHRGDLRASRKTGAFAPIVPLRPDDVEPAAVANMRNWEALLDDARRLLSDLSANRAKATRPNPAGTAP